MIKGFFKMFGSERKPEDKVEVSETGDLVDVTEEELLDDEVVISTAPGSFPISRYDEIVLRMGNDKVKNKSSVYCCCWEDSEGRDFSGLLSGKTLITLDSKGKVITPHLLDVLKFCNTFFVGRINCDSPQVSSAVLRWQKTITSDLDGINKVIEQNGAYENSAMFLYKSLRPQLGDSVFSPSGGSSIITPLDVKNSCHPIFNG